MPKNKYHIQKKTNREKKCKIEIGEQEHTYGCCCVLFDAHDRSYKCEIAYSNYFHIDYYYIRMHISFGMLLCMSVLFSIVCYILDASRVEGGKVCLAQKVIPHRFYSKNHRSKLMKSIICRRSRDIY